MGRQMKVNIESCSCRSVGECFHNMEIMALERLVDEFAKEMKKKLLLKLSQGYSGWDNLNWTLEQIQNNTLNVLEKGDPVDVANFCAFWWNRL